MPLEVDQRRLLVADAVDKLIDDIRNSLANETLKIVTDGTSTKVRLDTDADVETPRPYQLIHGTKPFMCTGIHNSGNSGGRP